MHSAIPVLAAWIFLAPTSRMSAPQLREGVHVDTIDFVDLGGSSEFADCAEGEAAGNVPCRVRRQWSAPALREHLAHGEAAWRHDDMLTFAYEGAADAVVLAGGIQMPMSPLRGSSLWVATIRIPSIDRAVVSYTFLPQGKAPARPPAPLATWRGPNAPAAPPRSAHLHGTLTTDTLRSRFLGGSRAVSVYAPPGAERAPPAGVVYMPDGQSVHGLAPVIDSLIVARRLPRILLVGAHSAGRGEGSGPLADRRALEYLYDYGATYGGNDARFQAHQRFFYDELVRWAEARYGAPARRRARVVFGFSNGGAAAIQQGLRRPFQYGRVIALSPAGHVPDSIATTRRRGAPAFLLAGGVLEPSLRRTAQEWNALLQSAGFETQLSEPVSGHDPNAWAAQLAEALEGAFAAQARTRAR
jgi:enterochelin esterase-like enzyme